MDAAIEYAKQGFAVFPLKPRNKTPIQGGGFKNATTDIPTIERWWNKTPNANIGIATGQMSGGIVVIDLDIDDESFENALKAIKFVAENNHLEIILIKNKNTFFNKIRLFFRKKNKPLLQESNNKEEK